MKKTPKKRWWFLYITYCFWISLTISALMASERKPTVIATTTIIETQAEASIKQTISDLAPERTSRHIPNSDVIINCLIQDICEEYGIAPELVESIVYQESRYKIFARNGNCVGLMQINKYIHKDRIKRLGVTDLYMPYDNILVGVDYLSELFEKHKDPALVLMLYNMKHDTAFALYKKGKVSTYAKEVLARSDALQQEVN